MKNTWVLSVKTSLPKVCARVGDLKMHTYAFDSFEEARDAARAVMKSLAFSPNTMFDGKGRIKRLSEYIEDMWGNDEDEDDEYDICLTQKKLTEVQDALVRVFEGYDVVPHIPEGEFTDWMIAYRYENGEIVFFGDDDGPCNGYDPTIKTNMFSMTEEKDYFMYIDDLFGQDDCSSELYIDLVKAKEFTV